MATAEALLPLTRSSSYEFIPPNMSELRVVLLGSSWIQRSLVGNLLVNMTAFNPRTEPQCSETARGPLKNKTITVINTPDLLHPDITEGRLTEAVEEFAELSKPGPHVFLLVLAPEDFTELQQLKLQSIIEKFTEQPFDHSMVLITTDTEESVSYLNNMYVEKIIQKCRYRHMCFQVFGEKDKRLKNFKLSELLARLGQIVKENNGDHLSSFKDTKQKETISSVEKVQKALSERYPRFTNLRILLIGQSQDKKDLLKNFITGGESRRRNQPTVVSTPDLFRMSVGQVREEIKRCVLQCSPGPNVLLLLVKPSDFTEENRETLKFILMWIGPRTFNHFNHCIVVFTDHEPKNECVRNLLSDCQFRYYEMFEENLSLLMEIIQFMMERNLGSHINVQHWAEESFGSSNPYMSHAPYVFPSYPDPFMMQHDSGSQVHLQHWAEESFGTSNPYMSHLPYRSSLAPPASSTSSTVKRSKILQSPYSGLSAKRPFTFRPTSSTPAVKLEKKQQQDLFKKAVEKLRDETSKD